MLFPLFTCTAASLLYIKVLQKVFIEKIKVSAV